MACENICVPYKTAIKGGLNSYKTINIKGVVNHDASYFVFNLRYGDGIAFHYNARFDQNVVVRNTMMKDSWGREEDFGPMPFIRGQAFQVVITCEKYHFDVFVNGCKAHTYNHRIIKLEEIDVLEIAGDLTSTSVEV